MSKSFNVDLNSFNGTTDMDNIYAGNIPVEQAPIKAVKDKKETKPVNKKVVSEDVKKTYDAKSGNFNKKNNYTITFKIDADLGDYLKNIDKITFIESIKSGKIDSTTRTEFVNDLIREQFYKLIGATAKDDAEAINQKWLKYKKDNNL